MNWYLWEEIKNGRGRIWHEGVETAVEADTFQLENGRTGMSNIWEPKYGISPLQS
jgi:hypothetical protein